MNSFKIGDFVINKFSKPIIVAELSGNHNGKIQNIFKLIDIAKSCGANAVKIQTYTADSLTLKIDNKNFRVKSNNKWKNKTLYNLYDEAHTPWEWHERIFSYAKKKNILCFSTPFDESAVDFLEKYNVKVYKIASFENSHHPLIEKIAKTRKPIIISSGMITKNDLKETISLIKKYHSKIVLLKCTSNYPSDISDANLHTINSIQKDFSVFSGLSDHSLSNIPSIIATSFGAKVIEKHLTLSRKLGGVDSFFSLEPQEFKEMVNSVNSAYIALGKIFYGPTNNEIKNSIKFRRSIFASKDIHKGEFFNEGNIKVIRPGNGLEPKYKSKILNKKSSKNIKKGTPIKWSHVHV